MEEEIKKMTKLEGRMTKEIRMTKLEIVGASGFIVDENLWE
jgi:hypothetical protein